MNQFRMGFAARIALLAGLFFVGLVATNLMWLSMTRTIEINGPLYKKIVQGKDLVADYLPPPLFVVEGYLLSYRISEETGARRSDFIERFRKGKQDFESRYQDWQKELDRADPRAKLIEESYASGKEFYRVIESEILNGTAKKIPTEAVLAFDRHRNSVEELIKIADNMIKVNEESARSTSSWWSTVQLLFNPILLVILGLISWFIAKGIQSINKSTGELVGQVKMSAMRVNSTATEIASAASAQNSTVQAFNSSFSEIAAAVKQISATSRELAFTIVEVGKEGRKTANMASEGRETLGAMENSMSTLADATTSISGKLGTIREKAGAINAIVTTITKVADQTNLLSINAAIEAEKAGEAGRGFLVVAREIRRLADQTAVATLDIEQIVRHMQQAVSTGVMEMDKFSEQVRSGMKRVGSISHQLGGIMGQVENQDKQFHQVESGVSQQAEGARQIETAISHLGHGVEQVASTSNEFSTAASHLRDSIQGLQDQVALVDLHG